MGIECSFGSGWGTHQGGGEKLVVFSLLSPSPLGCRPAPTFYVGIAQAFLAGPPVNPSSPPTSQGGSSSLCWMPGLGSQYAIHTVTPQGRYPPMDSPSSTESPPRGTGPNLTTSLPFLPCFLVIFPIALVLQKSF